MAFSTIGRITRSRRRRPASMIICGQRERRRGAAHVLLHQQHAGVRLDVEAAGVEGHALADQCDGRRVRRAPGEIDEPRRLMGRLPHGMDQRKAGLEIVRP